MATTTLGTNNSATRTDRLALPLAPRPSAYLPAAEMEVGRLLVPAGLVPPPVTRLVVLVPDEDLDETALARHIWKLAAPRQLAVTYLSWTASADSEARVRRRLANLASQTRTDGVVVGVRAALGAGWLPALHGLWRPGDLIVAHAEQRVNVWGVFARPLGQMLVAALNAPVYVLTGYCPKPVRPAQSLAGQVVTGALFAVVIAVFFGVQARLVQLPSRPLQSLLLLLSVVVEYGLLWGWNRLSG